MNRKQNVILDHLSNSTHLIEYVFTNHDNTTKKLHVFANADEPWFDHFYKNLDNRAVANGGRFGRLSSIVAGLGNLFGYDKSIKKGKTTIYNVADFSTPVVDYTEQNKKVDATLDVLNPLTLS